MVVRTGAFSYLQYGYEVDGCDDTTFGTVAAAMNKTFGLEQRITNWTFTNNRITLAELNQVEPAIYAYGTTRGSIGVDFVLSNPWWLRSLWDCVSTACCMPEAGANLHTYIIGDKLLRPISIEVGAAQECCNCVTRQLVGGIVNSVSLRSSIGEVVRGSADISYKTEIEACVCITDPMCIATDGVNFPYTFAYGALTTTAGTVAELQSFDINLNQNSDLLYDHASSEAVDAYRKLFEVTGSFTASYVDVELLRDIYAQARSATVCCVSVGVDCQAFAREQTTLTLTFDNGLTGANRDTITMIGTGLGFADQATAIEPNEPIFETLNWQIRDMTVTAANGCAGPPADI